MQSSESKASTGNSPESLLGRRNGPADFCEGSKVSFEESWQFIVKVGLTAHRYGSTAGMLETFLVDLSKKFGYQGVFRSTPSDIVFALRKSPDSPQRVAFIATPPPGVDLDKLARLGDLLNELKTGELSLADSDAERAASCSTCARNRAESEGGAGRDSLSHGVRGAAGGALFGVIIGGRKGAGRGAALGGGLGLLGGAARGSRDREANYRYYYDSCMRGQM